MKAVFYFRSGCGYSKNVAFVDVLPVLVLQSCELSDCFGDDTGAKTATLYLENSIPF
jgi:hypothetical protein